MALKHWKKITSEVKFKNPWWTYIVDKYLIDEAREGEYHYCHTEGSAFVIPVMDDGRILMVNQYRYLNDMESLEFPGGGVKPGETAEQTAHKELIEETGYDGELTGAGYFNPYSGITNELCRVFIGRNLKLSNQYSKDAHEEFELIPVTVNEIEN